MNSRKSSSFVLSKSQIHWLMYEYHAFHFCLHFSQRNSTNLQCHPLSINDSLSAQSFFSLSVHLLCVYRAYALLWRFHWIFVCLWHGEHRCHYVHLIVEGTERYKGKWLIDDHLFWVQNYDKICILWFSRWGFFYSTHLFHLISDSIVQGFSIGQT